MTQFATLLFPDYATAVAAAKALGFWATEEDRLRTGGQTIRADGTAFSWMIDEIGNNPYVPGIYDEEGNEISPSAQLTGYCVNVVGEIPESALQYKIPYGSAGRVFAGTEPEII